MKILITNDDGIHSPGLEVLADAFQSLGEVTVVAPDTERSAVGHSTTISHPLRVKEVKKMVSCSAMRSMGPLRTVSRSR